MKRTVQEHMTVEPRSVDAGSTVADAWKQMREHAIRHLPVLDGGKLVGVLSERDVNVARSLRSASIDTLLVSMLMNDRPLTVEPGAALSDVAARMIDRKVGSALVVHEGSIVGIFTTQDALHALHAILAVEQ